jgi:hypothetical protein
MPWLTEGFFGTLGYKNGHPVSRDPFFSLLDQGLRLKLKFGFCPAEHHEKQDMGYTPRIGISIQNRYGRKWVKIERARPCRTMSR